MNFEEIRNKIEEYEKKINNFEKQKALLEGKKEIILENLKKDYNFNENDNIEKILQEKEEDLKKLNESLFNKIKNFEEKMKEINLN